MLKFLKDNKWMLIASIAILVAQVYLYVLAGADIEDLPVFEQHLVVIMHEWMRPQPL